MMAMWPQCSGGRSLLFGANDDWMTSLLTYLSIEDICQLDVAVSDTTSRVTWLGILCMTNHYTIDEYSHSNQSIRWLVKREMRLKKLTVRGGDYGGEIVYGETLLGLNLSSLQYVSFYDCRIGENEVLLIAHGCPHLVEIRLSGCDAVTDESMIELVEYCHELISIEVEDCVDIGSGVGAAYRSQTTESLPSSLHTSLRRIFFSGCFHITDTGVSAISHKCRLLNDITLKGCVKITDMGVCAIGHNCSLLKKINLSECNKITDNGISALSHNCRLLIATNLRSCDKITDTSVLALSQSCSLMENVNLAECDKITDWGVMALAQNCPLLNDIDLYGCRQITDKGISALARNCRLLMKINFTYCNQITDIGISAVAFRCPLLSIVDLTYCNQITDDGVKALAYNCPLLTYVDISTCNRITHAARSALSNNCPLLDR